MAKLSDKKKMDQERGEGFQLPSSFSCYIHHYYNNPVDIRIRYTFWNGTGMSKDINYVGLKNYITVFRTKICCCQIRNTAIFTLVTLVTINALGLGLATDGRKEFKVLMSSKALCLYHWLSAWYLFPTCGCMFTAISLECSAGQAL